MYLILPISAQVPASNSQVSSTPSPCSDKFVGWWMETTSWQDMLWMFCQVPSLHPSHGSGGWEIYVSSMGWPTLRTGWHHSQVSCKLSLWLRQLYCSIGLPSWGPRPCHPHLWNTWEQIIHQFINMFGWPADPIGSNKPEYHKLTKIIDCQSLIHIFITSQTVYGYWFLGCICM